MRALLPPREGPETRALDVWLRRDFASRYDQALKEPLPAELLALLNAAH